MAKKHPNFKWIVVVTDFKYGPFFDNRNKYVYLNVVLIEESNGQIKN